ncbi:MAG: hypothetical protein MJY82_06260 [Fibrobacter sp.]|nr:hypothetical protein [Fibrobacter sp.]
MKKIFLTFLLINVLAFVACTTDADEEVDTFDASVVCPADGLNKYGEPNRGTFIDERDGQEYKYTTIGDQVWMAQNLNYETEKSYCLGKDPANCDLYGRFYYAYINNNLGFSGTVDWDMIDSICPKGWRVPILEEWKTLTSSVNSPDSTITANRLKSVDGWEYNHWGKGTDECGFSALPGGEYSRNLSSNGSSALFLLATAAYENMNYFIEISSRAEYGWSSYTLPVRCLKD